MRLCIFQILNIHCMIGRYCIILKILSQLQFRYFEKEDGVMSFFFGGWDYLKEVIFPEIPKNGAGILSKATPILTSSFYEYIFDPFILKYVIQI